MEVLGAWVFNLIRFTMEVTIASTEAVATVVIEMLKEDHEKVKGLFEEFESADGKEQAEIVATAILELEVHADLEESSSTRLFGSKSTRTR
jgi:hypothetical protein